MQRRARFWLGITVLAALVVAGGEAAAEVDILDYRLRDLMSADAMELDVFRGGVSVLMFFEPDCPYCFRQARVLNALQREYKDLHPIAIGLLVTWLRGLQTIDVLRSLVTRVDASACAPADGDP